MCAACPRGAGRCSGALRLLGQAAALPAVMSMQAGDAPHASGRIKFRKPWAPGTLPDSWSRMAKLQKLWLSGCGLRGALPASWGAGIPSLLELRLRYNAIGGDAPRCPTSRLLVVRLLPSMMDTWTVHVAGQARKSKAPNMVGMRALQLRAGALLPVPAIGYAALPRPQPVGLFAR